MFKVLRIKKLHNLDVKDIAKIEGLNIPFKERITEKTKIIYRDCIIDGSMLKKEEINDIIERKSKYIRYVEPDKEIVGYENLFQVFSDGGSFNNKKQEGLPYFGSYASVVLLNGKVIHVESGCTDEFTNNMGELTAALNGLKFIKKYIKENNLDSKKQLIILSTDSQYVTKGCSEYMKGWIKRGWKNNVGDPTPNRELWEEMLKLLKHSDLDIYFRWQKGHIDPKKYVGKPTRDILYNYYCDKLCNEAINNFFDSDYPQFSNKKRPMSKVIFEDWDLLLESH